MNTFQEQILLGTVLGGASLLRPARGRHHYLSMRGADQDWLVFKMNDMPDLFPVPEVRKYGAGSRCDSRCSSLISELYCQLYRGGKRRPTFELLEGLMDIGLAVWFIDGGGFTGRGRRNAYFNTTKFGPAAAEVARYFNTSFMPGCINRWPQRSRFVLGHEGTERLLRTIGHRLPSYLVERFCPPPNTEHQ